LSADDVAEHPVSAATMHTHAAQMTGPFVSIWRGLAWLEHPMAAGALIRPGPGAPAAARTPVRAKRV
jgi:hypothetical protein